MKNKLKKLKKKKRKIKHLRRFDLNNFRIFFSLHLYIYIIYIKK